MIGAGGDEMVNKSQVWRLRPDLRKNSIHNVIVSFFVVLFIFHFSNSKSVLSVDKAAFFKCSGKDKGFLFISKILDITWI